MIIKYTATAAVGCNCSISQTVWHKPSISWSCLQWSLSLGTQTAALHTASRLVMPQHKLLTWSRLLKPDLKLLYRTAIGPNYPCAAAALTAIELEITTWCQSSWRWRAEQPTWALLPLIFLQLTFRSLAPYWPIAGTLNYPDWAMNRGQITVVLPVISLTASR